MLDCNNFCLISAAPADLTVRYGSLEVLNKLGKIGF